MPVGHRRSEPDAVRPARGRARLTRSLGRHVLGAGAVLVVTSAVLFTAVEVLPGDLAAHVLGPNATPDRVEALRTELQLDAPPVERYLDWLTGAVRGDLGTTARGNRPVSDLLGPAARNTAILGGLALVSIAGVGVGLGLVAGRRSGSRTDRVLSTATLAGVAVPEFVVAGLLVTTVAFGFGVLPAVSLVPAGGTPLDRPDILVLPLLSLTVVGGSFTARLVRSVVADAESRPHVRAARLAGLAEPRVLVHHLLPTAAGPIAQVLAFMVPYLVGGTVVVERVFSYPGLGSLLVDQIAVRDAPVVLAIGLLIAFAVVVAFVVADLVEAATTPPVRAW